MKKALLILSLFLCSLHAVAQSITTLDWDELRIDSLLPYYTEVVPLPHDYAAYTFSVRAEYASWGRLTAAEELAARRHIHSIADTLRISANVGIVRGEGELDISFIPIIYNKESGQFRKLLQCKLAIKPTPLHRQSAAKAQRRNASQTYTANSVLSAGRWVKIAIPSDGMYALTPSLIKQMGFSNPSKVRLFGYGGHLQDEIVYSDSHWDDLQEVPLVHGTNGQLLFWGNGVQHWDESDTSINSPHHRTNNYSTQGFYFVTEGTPAAIESIAPGTASNPLELSSFNAHALRDVDEFAFAQMGRYLWEGTNLADGAVHTFKLDTPFPANGTAKLMVSAAALDANTLLASFDGKALSNTTISAPAKYNAAGTATSYHTVTVARNTSELSLQMKGKAQTHLDFIELTYPRLFRLSGSHMPFSLTQSGSVSFTLTPQSSKQDIRLMRIGTQSSAAALITPSQGLTYVIDQARGDYVAFDLKASDYPVPSIVGPVDCQNLHAHGSVDMVIITPASGIFDAQAARLAQAHAQYDGLTCRVVRADLIYNEFSSGTPDATAYRRYLKMLYDRAASNGEEPVRYLLLFGDCAWDNRMLTQHWKGFSPDNFLLCYESANSLSDTKGYVAEDYFALLDDGEGNNLTTNKFDIAVGRFPVQNRAEAEVAVNKTITHLRNADKGSWQNLALVMGDDGDENSHMKYADKAADILLSTHPEIDTRKLMWDTYKRVSTTTGNTYPDLSRDIQSYLKNGAMLFNYVGHGATYVLSHENVVRLATMQDFTNARQGLWFTAACDIMPFDGRVDNLGEAMFLNPKGGAAAFIGTARTVYANYNSTLNNYFVRYLFDVDNNGRRLSVGDALRIAKNNTQTYEVNKLQYALAGDPSLVFGQPLMRVVIDSINGTPVTDSAQAQLKAGSKARFVGHIENADGTPATSFDGLFNTRIYDNKQRITCLNQAVCDTAYYFFEHRKLLFEHTDSVRKGQLDFSFIVPLDINYSNDNGRAVFYAYSKNMAANGACSNFIVGGTAIDSDDTTGPVISLWLDSQDFEEGGSVGPMPLLFAEVEDDSGLNFAAAGIGHGLELCIDGRSDMTYDLSSAFTSKPGSTRSGSLTYRLPLLEQGRHTLSLRAWDVYNNPSQKSIAFNVVGTDTSRPVSLFVSSQTAASAVVTLVNRITGQPLQATLYVYNSAGQLCHTTQAANIEAGTPFHFVLGFNGVDGPATPGLYYIRADVRQGTHAYQTDTQKVALRKF